MSSSYSFSLLPSTAITDTVNTANVTNSPNVPFAQICINISSFTSGSITPHIQGYDPASGLFYDILVAGTPLASTGLTVLTVGPAVGASSTSAANFMPAEWRVQLVAASSTVLTASVGVNQGV